MVGVVLNVYWAARISKRGLAGMKMGNLRFGRHRTLR